MIHVSKLPGEYFIYDENRYEMVGETTGKTFKLGDVLKVCVTGTDKLSRTIDFALIDEADEVNWEEYL